MNDLGGSETSSGWAQLLLQTNPETVTEEGNQDMGFNAALDPVKDGSQVQFAFECAENGFNLGELNVLLPELLRIAIG